MISFYRVRATNPWPLGHDLERSGAEGVVADVCVGFMAWIRLILDSGVPHLYNVHILSQ